MQFWRFFFPAFSVFIFNAALLKWQKCWMEKISPAIFFIFFLDLLAPHFQRFPSLTIAQPWHDVNTEMFVSLCVTAGRALQVLSTSRRGVHPQEIQATPNQIPGSFEAKEKRNQIQAHTRLWYDKISQEEMWRETTERRIRQQNI